MRTSTETLACLVLPGTGVTQGRPTPSQALSEPQDRKGSEEIQGNEAPSGARDFRDSQASPLFPTCLAYPVTKGRQAYLAWKVTEGPLGRLGRLLFPETKETKETQELRETPGPKGGVATLGPRAGPACSDSQERKDPEGTLDSWETQEPLGVWATEAPRDPRETEDSQVLPVPWDPLGLQGSPRGLPSSRGQWVRREGEAPQGRRARWGPRAPQENQVSVGLPERQGPRGEAVCLLSPDSEETRGPWDSRGQWARKGSRAAQEAPGCQACRAAA